MPRLKLVLAALMIGSTARAQGPAPSQERLTAEVRRTETAFAATMAARDFSAFAEFVAEDAIFFGAAGAQRGKAAVLDKGTAVCECARTPESP